jgi:hypothetical protein
MATWQFNTPHFIGSRYYEIGEIASDSGPGATLPANWPPTPTAMPMDADAQAMFFAAGPRGLTGAEYALPFGWDYNGAQKWVGLPGINARKAYWVHIAGTANPTLWNCIIDGINVGTAQGS